MLVINERLDKLAACRVDFEARGMLSEYLFRVKKPDAGEDNEEEDQGAVDGRDIIAEVKLARKPVRKYPHYLTPLSQFLQLPALPNLVCRFLYSQIHGPIDIPLSDIPINQCPSYDGKVYVYPSAIATFFAPSDESGVGGMHRERIRWPHHGEEAVLDRIACLWSKIPIFPGFGLLVARVHLLFSLKHEGVIYPCALVRWYSAIGEDPDDETGMWMVEPDEGDEGMDVIHLNSVLRAAHLIGIAGERPIPKLRFTDSLDVFEAFYNKYADHHTHEIAF